MIRGPVLPSVREALWSLIATRLSVIERGLTLVAEGIDCSAGQCGLVEGLARDANGAPVLVLVAADGDPLLPARALAASEFLARVGDSLSAAIPEGAFCSGLSGRAVVVGGEAGRAGLELLRRLALPGLQVCRLEPFRVGGAERFAVRWLAVGAGSAATCDGAEAPAEFAVPPAGRAAWAAIQAVCPRIDPAVRIDGGRFERRITWRGRLLGEVLAVDGELRAIDQAGAMHGLSGDRDVRSFTDSLLRGYSQAAGLGLGGAGLGRRSGVVDRSRRGETLREALNASRVSNEESAALADGAGHGDPVGENGTAADIAGGVAAEGASQPGAARSQPERQQ